MNIYSLVINITELCNMNCKFCLRGDGGTKKMNLDSIPNIFDGVDSISSIVISGGEPSCYVEAVTAIVDYLETTDIDVSEFFIFTNGKEYKEELVDAVKRMKMRHVMQGARGLKIQNPYIDGAENFLRTTDGKGFYVDDYEAQYGFCIGVSLDKYHEEIPLENYLKYLYSGVYTNSKEWHGGDEFVIARGRGRDIPNASKRKYREFCITENYGEIEEVDEVYITCDGKVFSDCDMSYKMEKHHEPAGNVNEESLASIIKRYVGVQHQ